jgi:hypothetical protein
MMSVFVVVMTLCTPAEGCSEERKPTAYASREECMETLAAIPTYRGVKYRCTATSKMIVSEDRRATKSHLATTAAPAAALPEAASLKP